MAYNLPQTGAELEKTLAAAVLPGEPNGFVDRSASTISWDASTRTFTISPVGASYDIWLGGVKVTITEPKSVVWQDVEGTKLFAFDAETGLLTVENAFTSDAIGEDALVAYLYWDAQNNEVLLDSPADERHGYQMPAAVHRYLHSYVGARYGSGLDLVLGGVDESGNEDAHAQFLLSAGTIADEDITHAIAAKAALTDPFRVLYQLGVPGTWRQAPASSFPVVLVDGVCQYNAYAGGVYTLAPVSNNDFFFAHIAVTGLVSGNPQYFVLLGQAEYSSANQARVAAASEIARLNLDGLPSPEIVILYSVLLQYQSGDDNGAKAHVVSLDDGDYVDYRVAKGVARATAEVA